MYTLHASYAHVYIGWRKCIECLKLQISFRKRATNYRALLRKIINCKGKASYASSRHPVSPLLGHVWTWCVCIYIYIYTHTNLCVCVCACVCMCVGEREREKREREREERERERERERECVTDPPVLLPESLSPGVFWYLYIYICICVCVCACAREREGVGAKARVKVSIFFYTRRLCLIFRSPWFYEALWCVCVWYGVATISRLRKIIGLFCRL